MESMAGWFCLAQVVIRKTPRPLPGYREATRAKLIISATEFHDPKNPNGGEVSGKFPANFQGNLGWWRPDGLTWKKTEPSLESQ